MFTGDILLLATLESKKCRAWYGFMLVNEPQTCMVHSHYGSCLLLPLLIWTAEQHSLVK